ncbi:hypothetical protein APS56_08340 [Pseudalgibacter alginicilyticus]|uniref:Uncharacterized protein n=1 Tax=Pseudalgibacter alginicilyticus TaxID=1736674 RepID=A0A0P0D4M9_9FLAO|nr:hypothetical protein [Pseudalgibacter alginicilyticus]ALJ05133.1 hypothetical protein APS56_08340 [Pseudalgibacter alginicilyticus]
MKTYKNKNQELQAKIIDLENKKTQEFLALKTELNTAYAQLKPSNLLKRAVTDIKEKPETKNNLFEILISLTGGYVSKKLLVGKSNSLIKNILGYAVQYVSTKVISKTI